MLARYEYNDKNTYCRVCMWEGSFKDLQLRLYKIRRLTYYLLSDAFNLMVKAPAVLKLQVIEQIDIILCFRIRDLTKLVLT